MIRSHCPTAWLGLLLLQLLFVGCAGGPLSDTLFAWLPERADDPADLDRYGPTPSEQRVILERLCEEVESADPTVHARLAIKLSHHLQMEMDPLLRIHIVQSLGRLRAPEAMHGLATALSDTDSDVRVAACEALRRQGSTDASTLLAEVVGSELDLDVRLAATRALGNFNDYVAKRGLVIALDDDDPAVQYRAIESLRKMSEIDYGNDLGAWRQFAQGGSPTAPNPPSLADRWRRWF